MALYFCCAAEADDELSAAAMSGHDAAFSGSARSSATQARSSSSMPSRAVLRAVSSARVAGSSGFRLFSCSRAVRIGWSLLLGGD